MHGHAAMDTELGRRAVDGATDGIGAQLFVGPFSRKEQRAAWPFETPILAQGRQQTPGQRNQARPIALAMANVDEACLAIDVGDFERQDFRNAQARAVGGHHHHAILERLDFAEQGLNMVAVDNRGQLLGHARPGDVLHLAGTAKRDGIEEAQAGDVHLDAGSARAALVVQQQKVTNLLAAHLGGRAHVVPHEPSGAPQIALLRANGIATKLEIGCHLLVQLTHGSSPCGCRRPSIGHR